MTVQPACSDARITHTNPASPATEACDLTPDGSGHTSSCIGDAFHYAQENPEEAKLLSMEALLALMHSS